MTSKKWTWSRSRSQTRRHRCRPHRCELRTSDRRKGSQRCGRRFYLRVDIYRRCYLGRIRLEKSANSLTSLPPLWSRLGILLSLYASRLTSALCLVWSNEPTPRRCLSNNIAESDRHRNIINRGIALGGHVLPISLG